MTFPSGHGGDFAIVSPSGDYYFVAFNQPDPGSPVQPIISADLFKRQSALVSPVKDLKGINWSSKGGQAEQIFRSYGRYRIVVSGALETEDPILDGWCDVDFKIRSVR